MRIKLRNFEIKKKEKKNPKLSNLEVIYLLEFLSYVARLFYFHFFNLSYKKLAMASQFELTWFYDIIVCNPVFLLRNSRSPSI